MVELDVEERVDYTQYTNRQLAIGPLILLALALAIIGGWWMLTGSPVNPGIEFTGGTQLKLISPGGEAAITEAFETQPENIRPVLTESNAYIVTFDTTASEGEAESLADVARQAGMEVEFRQTTSPSFGEGAQLLAVGAIAVAFIAMSIVVFILFRTFIPSIAVVISAFSDIMIPLAIMNLTGIQLTLGTIAALLMLIGYSVDSDILLNNHILRRRGGFYESTYRAMETGITMTLTSLAASIVMAVVAYLFGVDLLAAIGTVLAIGLAVDLMNTYLLNLSLLRWYKKVEV